ncbi:MAG TPA: hypothetical protein VNS09_23870 [Solirubrobacter sp.]|nr:hypothetical protein [Solirubrobacter sp.]
MRLALIVTAAVLAFAAPAAAQDITLSLPIGVLTNDPVLDIRVDPPDTPVKCRLADADPEPCTFPWRPHVTADGVYEYDVIVGIIQRRGTFTVDRTPPRLAFTAGPEEGSEQLTREAAFAFSATDEHLDGVACTVDGAAVACADRVELTGLEPGAHAVTVTARDTAGNEATLTRRFTVVTATVIVDPPAPKVTPGATPTSVPQGDVRSSHATSPKLTVTAKRTRAWTRLTALKLTELPARAAVKVTCAGKGCPKRAVRATGTGKVTIRALAARKLKPGAVVRVRVTAKGAPGRTFTVRVRATKAPLIT